MCESIFSTVGLYTQTIPFIELGCLVLLIMIVDVAFVLLHQSPIVVGFLLWIGCLIILFVLIGPDELVTELCCTTEFHDSFQLEDVTIDV